MSGDKNLSVNAQSSNDASEQMQDGENNGNECKLASCQPDESYARHQAEEFQERAQQKSREPLPDCGIPNRADSRLEDIPNAATVGGARPKIPRDVPRRDNQSCSSRGTSTSRQRHNSDLPSIPEDPLTSCDSRLHVICVCSKHMPEHSCTGQQRRLEGRHTVPTRQRQHTSTQHDKTGKPHQSGRTPGLTNPEQTHRGENTDRAKIWMVFPQNDKRSPELKLGFQRLLKRTQGININCITLNKSNNYCMDRMKGKLQDHNLILWFCIMERGDRFWVQKIERMINERNRTLDATDQHHQGRDPDGLGFRLLFFNGLSMEDFPDGFLHGMQSLLVPPFPGIDYCDEITCLMHCYSRRNINGR